MSTTDITHKTTMAWFIGLAAAVVVCLGLALAVNASGEPATAAGIVTGGMFAVIVAALGRWRTGRAAERSGVATRIAAGRLDERDVRVHQGTLAIVGVVAIILSGFASAATFMDVDAAALLHAMPFALLLTTVVAFVVVNRRT